MEKRSQVGGSAGPTAVSRRGLVYTSNDKAAKSAGPTAVSHRGGDESKTLPRMTRILLNLTDV